MEVLLKEAIDNLGMRGEVVKVRDGYARNFLFPRQLAVTVTEENKRRLQVEQKVWEQKDLAHKAQADEMAKKLESVSVNIAAHATDDGVLFGSINERMIAQAFAEQEHIELDHRVIVIDASIKEVGQYTAHVKLHREVLAPLNFWVNQKRD